MAGLPYTLTCTVSIIEGLTVGPREFLWLDANDEEVIPDGDLVVEGPVTSGLVTTLNLHFDQLRISDEGDYTCLAEVASPALSTSLNQSAEEYIDVELSKHIFTNKLFIGRFVNCSPVLPTDPPLIAVIVDVNDPIQRSEYIYQPGSMVVLNCSVVGASGPLVYEWTSTCSGDCFVLEQQSESVIESGIIHSGDAGNHTCTVTDDTGNYTTATIEMQVIGELIVATMGLYD